MRSHWMPAVLMLTLAAGPALASFSNKPDPSTSSSSTSGSTIQATDPQSARQQAEKWYHDAYEDVTKAKEALADPENAKDNAKKAKKLFERSIDRAGRALEFDKNYFEAWNLQGFAWRNLGKYDKSVAAYEQCLAIAPDYAPAREYYGQALLESGDRKGAEEQLAYLKKLNSEEHVKLLEAALAATPAVDEKAKAEKAKAEEKSGTPAGGGH